jgi:hypothetical protein
LPVASWSSNREIGKKGQRKCQIFHRCGITRTGYLSAIIGNLLPKQFRVATVVLWSFPYAFSGLFLLMKWNGRASTMGYSVLYWAKIGVNKFEIN